MKKEIIFIFVGFLLIGLSFDNLLAAEKQITKPIELSYANFFPSANHQFILGTKWAEEIEKRTGGKVKITLYPGASLLAAEKIYEGTVKGVCDIGMTCLSYTRGRFPLMEVLDMPLGFPNAKIVVRVMWDVYKKFKPNELADTKVLYFTSHEPGLISFSSEQVSKLEQMKGKKIRCTGTAAEIVVALGGAPLAMTMGDVYLALSKGVVDGTVGAFNTLKAYRHAEVTKWSTYHPRVGYTTVMVVAMSLEKWNHMPSDIQKIFEVVSEEWIDKHGLRSHEMAQEGYEFAKEKGHKFTFLEDDPKEANRWIKNVEPIIDSYKKRMQEKGLPGEAVVKEARQLIEYYNKIDKYKGGCIKR